MRLLRPRTSGIPIYAGDTWDSNVILDAAKGKDVTINITTFYQEGGNKEFDDGFKKWLNADAANLTNNGGNDIVVRRLRDGLRRVFHRSRGNQGGKHRPNPPKIMEALWGVEYKGVTGDIKFDGDERRRRPQGRLYQGCRHKDRSRGSL